MSSVSRSDASNCSVNTSRWLELPYLGVDFKRVSSVPSPSSGSPGGAGPFSGTKGDGGVVGSSSGAGGRLWALGSDHQIYVFVFGVEVPIRVQEVGRDELMY